MQPFADSRLTSDDRFATYLRTGRRAAALEYKFNHNHDPKSGRFTFASGAGVRLDPEARSVAQVIADDFHRRTGKKITVNSGTRSPEKQAAAMLGKRSDWEIYNDQRAAAEISAALTRSGTRPAGATAMRKSPRWPKSFVGRSHAAFTYQTT